MNGPEDCTGGVCVTCSDQALPMSVVRLLEGELAIVDAGGVLEEVSVALVDPAVGDTVLVHAREAIAVIAHRSDNEDDSDADADSNSDNDSRKDGDEQAR
ncbi:HypC/HybG/HupF family hydrogenase formation chaperone [Streptosporangium sp. NPDC002524]|uniref:HypC/HybG/HupF family hydrogenase formation chaperone n=1 Tax=Streptosporangium sp. NPDC002524 TaxID=3154537 RepID=UPI00331909EE